MGRLTRRAESDEVKAVYLYENTIDDTNCFLEGEYGYKAFDKLATYEDICDDPEKLKEFDEIYLDRCREINRLNKELAEIRNKTIEEFIEKFIYKAVCEGCSGCCNCYEKGRQSECEDWNALMKIAEKMKEV